VPPTDHDPLPILLKGHTAGSAKGSVGAEDAAGQHPVPMSLAPRRCRADGTAYALAEPQRSHAGPETHKETTMSDATKDKVTGAFDQAKGQGKEAWGNATGDAQTEGEGKLDQAKGKVEQGMGKAKDMVGDAKDKAGDAMKNLTGKADDK
jgi:uncharacterized protein YjbJ (UPF0337 family)